jgi:inner membrane protein
LNAAPAKMTVETDPQANASTHPSFFFQGLSVNLVEPVNVYSTTDRASKYGLLFVVLTFVAFFMFELVKELRIHPIQYLLVGMGLTIFFLLLLSLSEHIPFVYAYLVASVACIGLLTYYLSFVLSSMGRGLGFGAMLTALYGALYGLLISEDNSLVLGSLLLFGVLATVMVITRKVDWYQVTNGASTSKRRNNSLASENGAEY